MLEYDADGGRLLRPTADEWAALLDGRVAEVEGTPVLEARLVEMFARYAIEQGAWSTPLTEAFLELSAWHHWSHRIWWPRLLLWPAGKPDLAKRSFTMHDRLYLKVSFRPFRCFTCGAWMDAYAVDRDVYPFRELSRSTSTLAGRTLPARAVGAAWLGQGSSTSRAYTRRAAQGIPQQMNRQRVRRSHSWPRAEVCSA